MIWLSKEQVKNQEYKQYDPETHDFIWNDDYTECYIKYQGDSFSNEEMDTSTTEENLSFVEPENEYFSDVPF